MSPRHCRGRGRCRILLLPRRRLHGTERRTRTLTRNAISKSRQFPNLIVPTRHARDRPQPTSTARSCGTTARVSFGSILLKNSKSRGRQISVRRRSSREYQPIPACGLLRGPTSRHQLFLVLPQLEVSFAPYEGSNFFIGGRDRVFQQNRSVSDLPADRGHELSSTLNCNRLCN